MSSATSLHRFLAWFYFWGELKAVLHCIFLNDFQPEVASMYLSSPEDTLWKGRKKALSETEVYVGVINVCRALFNLCNTNSKASSYTYVMLL